MEHSIASHLGFYRPQERQMVFPCDHYMSDSDDVYFRAIDVKAPADSISVVMPAEGSILQLRLDWQPRKSLL